MATLKELAREYWSHRPMELAAALSYYTLLSLAPLVLMAVAVGGLVFDRATVESRIVTEMRLLVGAEGSEVVRTVLRHARDPGKARSPSSSASACSSSGRPRCSCSCRPR
jgi:membrane protein